MVFGVHLPVGNKIDEIIYDKGLSSKMCSIRSLVSPKIQSQILMAFFLRGLPVIFLEKKLKSPKIS